MIQNNTLGIGAKVFGLDGFFVTTAAALITNVKPLAITTAYSRLNSVIRDLFKASNSTKKSRANMGLNN